jgi:hypothetical protein
MPDKCKSAEHQNETVRESTLFVVLDELLARLGEKAFTVNAARLRAKRLNGETAFAVPTPDGDVTVGRQVQKPVEDWA